MKPNLEGQIGALKKMHDASEIDSQVYYQLLFGIAYEYMLGNAILDSLAVLKLIPTEFFNQSIPELAAQSKIFLDMAEQFADLLVEAGVVQDSNNLNYNFNPSSSMGGN